MDITTPTTTQDTASEKAVPAFTSEQYHWLIDAGILTSEDRVELIGGEIKHIVPTGDDHGDSIEHTGAWLAARAAEDYTVRCQVTLRLEGDFSPDPDFTLLRYREGGYNRSRRPSAEDVLLIIEIADSSLELDLGRKALAYARAGVLELWVVDLPHRQIHVLIQPSADGYRARTAAGERESVTALLIPGLTMPVQAAL